MAKRGNIGPVSVDFERKSHNISRESRKMATKKKVEKKTKSVSPNIKGREIYVIVNSSGAEDPEVFDSMEDLIETAIDKWDWEVSNLREQLLNSDEIVLQIKGGEVKKLKEFKLTISKPQFQCEFK